MGDNPLRRLREKLTHAIRPRLNPDRDGISDVGRAAYLANEILSLIATDEDAHAIMAEAIMAYRPGILSAEGRAKAAAAAGLGALAAREGK